MKGNTKDKRINPRPFRLGHIWATPGAEGALSEGEMLCALARHSGCDWGDCCPEDWEENDLSVENALRLVSVYHSEEGTRFWIITEAGRHYTTILLPEEY